MFGFNYKEDFERLLRAHKRLAEQYADLNQKYETEILINSKLVNKLVDYEAEEAQAIIEQHELETDEESYIDKLKRERNRAYNAGRFDAYSEMGVRVLQARKDGSKVEVYVDKFGNIDEIIEVIPEESLVEFCEKEDIDISDLVDIA